MALFPGVPGAPSPLGSSSLGISGTWVPPVEVYRPIVTYLQFPIPVCFLCNDHAQLATRTWHHIVLTTPSQLQLRHPLSSLADNCEINSSMMSFLCRKSFLPRNHQCQSTEGNTKHWPQPVVWRHPFFFHIRTPGGRSVDLWHLTY